jgi:single-strand DNA-binding protein
VQNINSVTLTGNLTRDPELRSLPSGMSVCSLRIACNGRRKNPTTGEWGDKPNFFDVTVWGKQGENAARFLTKGRPIALKGRLDWREWQAQDGSKRQSVEVVAEDVQFLYGPEGRQDGGGSYSSQAPPASDVPSDTSSFEPSPGESGYGSFTPPPEPGPSPGTDPDNDDDIPFAFPEFPLDRDAIRERRQ